MNRLPELAVVVPSVNGWSVLEGVLDALENQNGDVELEIIVADRVGDVVRGPLQREFPAVRLIEASSDTSIPRLRALSIASAQADVVAVIEDHVLVPPDWAERMLEAHRAGAVVVGGAIENAATEDWVDWAAFLCEYSHCLEPPPAGPTQWVAGNNVSYRRSLLERYRDVVESDCWENVLHDAMRSDGVTLHSRPDIRVGHKMHHTVGSYMEQRYLYSRSFAAMRMADASRLARALYGTAALALPPVLFGRIVARVWRTRRHRTQLLFSLPLLVPFVLAWAMGETVGAWRGGGDALARVC